MLDQATLATENVQNHEASAALLSDAGNLPTKQSPSQESWLSTIVDYVPDKLGAPSVVSKLLPTFVKTAALFYPGAAGVAAYIGMSALDQAHPGDTFAHQAEDLALGAGKGALMAGAFRATAALPGGALGLAGRGVALGVSSRILDTGLARSTYIDPSSGAFDLGGGLTRTLATSFQPGALAIDAASFMIAGGLAKQASALTRGALATNFVATNAITGGVFGFSSGAFGELAQEKMQHQSLNPLAILGQGLECGAVMAAASIPGGLAMQHEFNVNVSQAALASAKTKSSETPANENGGSVNRENSDGKGQPAPVPGRLEGNDMHNGYRGGAMSPRARVAVTAQELAQEQDSKPDTIANTIAANQIKDAQTPQPVVTEAPSLATPKTVYRSNQTVQAVPLEKTEKLPDQSGNLVTAQPGDWKVTDAEGRSMVLSRREFKAGFARVTDGDMQSYNPLAVAQMVTSDTPVHTAGGDVTARSGDFLVTRANGEQRLVPGTVFGHTYFATGTTDNSLPAETMTRLPEDVQRLLKSSGFDSGETGSTLESEGINWTAKPDGTRVTSWAESGTRRIISPDQTQLDILSNGLMRAERQVTAPDSTGTQGVQQNLFSPDGNAALKKAMSDSLIQVRSQDKIIGLDPRVTTTEADGTIIAKYPGTTYTYKPDGTTVEDFDKPSAISQLSQVMTEPDGTVSYVNADGSKMIKRPGTAQGEVELYAGDGRRTNMPPPPAQTFDGESGASANRSTLHDRLVHFGQGVGHAFTNFSWT